MIYLLRTTIVIEPLIVFPKILEQLIVVHGWLVLETILPSVVQLSVVVVVLTATAFIFILLFILFILLFVFVAILQLLLLTVMLWGIVV